MKKRQVNVEKYVEPSNPYPSKPVLEIVKPISSNSKDKCLACNTSKEDKDMIVPGCCSDCYLKMSSRLAQQYYREKEELKERRSHPNDRIKGD